MNKLTDRQQQYLKFLCADIESTKAEIVRRSNLQRVVLAAYITVIVFEEKSLVSYQLTAPLVVSLWVSGMLALQFYTREHIEISRLGSILRERIAPIASNILRVQRGYLLPSVTNNKFPEIDKITSCYDLQFKWILFLLLPLAVTVFYLSNDWTRLSKFLDIHERGLYLAGISFISGLRTLYLLIKHHLFG